MSITITKYLGNGTINEFDLPDLIDGTVTVYVNEVLTLDYNIIDNKFIRFNIAPTGTIKILTETTDEGYSEPISPKTQDALDTKQDLLINQTNIKSINGNTILGSGDLPITVGSGGFAANLYFTELTSSLNGSYKQLSYVPDGTETIKTIICNNGETAGETYLFDLPIDTTIIDAGKYLANIYCSTDSNVGETRLRLEIFMRETNGTENTLFSMTSQELTNVLGYVEFENTQSLFNVSTTASYGIRVFANTTSNSDITVSYYVGDGNSSYTNTPLATRHSQLRNRDADNSHPISAITGLQDALDAAGGGGLDPAGDTMTGDLNMTDSAINFNNTNLHNSINLTAEGTFNRNTYTAYRDNALLNLEQYYGARGTQASPSSLSNGDRIQETYFRGYHTSGYSLAKFSAFVDGNPVTNRTPIGFKWTTVDDTGTSHENIMSNKGYLGIGGITNPNASIHINNDGDQSFTGTPAIHIENLTGGANNFANVLLETDSGTAFVGKNSGVDSFGGSTGGMVLGTADSEDVNIISNLNTVMRFTPNGDINTFSPNGSGKTTMKQSNTISVSTTETLIISAGNGGLVAVFGESGGNQFYDLVFFTSYGTTPTVLSSQTIVGSPVARTYTSNGGLNLTMASDTYNVVGRGIMLF